jgi:hypothetical protein
MKEFVLFGLYVLFGIHDKILGFLVTESVPERGKGWRRERSRRKGRGRRKERERDVPSHTVWYSTFIGIREPKKVVWDFCFGTIRSVKNAFFDTPIHGDVLVYPREREEVFNFLNTGTEEEGKEGKEVRKEEPLYSSSSSIRCRRRFTSGAVTFSHV